MRQRWWWLSRINVVSFLLWVLIQWRNTKWIVWRRLCAWVRMVRACVWNRVRCLSMEHSAAEHFSISNNSPMLLSWHLNLTHLLISVWFFDGASAVLPLVAVGCFGVYVGTFIYIQICNKININFYRFLLQHRRTQTLLIWTNFRWN